MRCLVPISACVLSPLALTVGAATLLGSLACLAAACDWAENGKRATGKGQGATGRAGTAATDPEPVLRSRRRGTR